MRLPDDITALLGSTGGVLDVGAAEAVGISPDRLEHLARTGGLVRLRRGIYGAGGPLPPWDAYRREVRAAVGASRVQCWATRWAGIVVHDLPHLGRPPGLVHLVRDRQPGAYPSRHGRTSTLVAAVPDETRRVVDGVPVCSPERVVLDTARTGAVVDALVAADAVLHRGVADPGVLVAEAARQADWPGGRRASWVAGLADGGAENPLESLGRLACIEFRLPVPLSNVWVGEHFPEYRVDHLWPDHWLVGEGDGMEKYEDDGAIEAEKERQWRLEQLGLSVVRYGWTHAYRRRPVLAARFADRLDRPGIPAGSVRWWPRDAR